MLEDSIDEQMEREHTSQEKIENIKEEREFSERKIEQERNNVGVITYYALKYGVLL